MINIFDPKEVKNLLSRIDRLTPENQAKWGTMDVAQMLAHCNVTYEMAYEDKHPPAKGFKKLLLKWFVKPVVVNEKPYKKNSPTAPVFKISDARVFEQEKERLKNYIQKTLEHGSAYFDGKISNSFGNLTIQQWNNMLAKHLDHHLSQFDV
jgi:Protein of unknown function (DUF1569)